MFQSEIDLPHVTGDLQGQWTPCQAAPGTGDPRGANQGRTGSQSRICAHGGEGRGRVLKLKSVQDLDNILTR